MTVSSLHWLLLVFKLSNSAHEKLLSFSIETFLTNYDVTYKELNTHKLLHCTKTNKNEIKKVNGDYCDFFETGLCVKLKLMRASSSKSSGTVKLNLVLVKKYESDFKIKLR